MADQLFRPSRSDVWLADFDHIELDVNGQIKPDVNGNPIYTRHREHGGKRPCVVLSNDAFNNSRSELVIVVPITSQDKRVGTHVSLSQSEGGLPRPSFVICEGVRSISRHFLIRKYGVIKDRTMREIMYRLGDLLLF